MLTITSPAFIQNGKLPKKYTCDGEAVNPPLLITNIPGQSKSLALIVDDPDAPNGTFTHLIAWNIDPKNPEISQNSMPDYIAACPPSGIHHYNFKVYALDTILSLPKGSDRRQLESAMTGHVIDKDVLTATYSRS